MAAEMDLYNDVINNRIVLGLNNAGAFTLPDLYQGQLKIRYYPCRPTNSVVAPFYSLISVGSISLEIGIGARAGAANLLAFEDDWTAVGSYLEGTLDLNTSEMNTELGSSDYINSYFEIKISEGGAARPTYQSSVKVFSSVIGPATPEDLPLPQSEYLTKAEILQQFPKWQNDAATDRGKGILLTSPNGNSKVLLWIDDTGIFHQDPVT